MPLQRFRTSFNYSCPQSVTSVARAGRMQIKHSLPHPVNAIPIAPNLAIEKLSSSEATSFIPYPWRKIGISLDMLEKLQQAAGRTHAQEMVQYRISLAPVPRPPTLVEEAQVGVIFAQS